MAPTITGRCLCASAMLSAFVVNAVQDGTFPSEGLTSSVDIRNLDSFMLSKPTHYDFENVMFYDGDMYLYAGSEERKTELEAQLKDWKDAVYKQATSPLPLPAVHVFATNYPTEDACETAFDGVASFYVPWQHNVFHMHNSNIIALASTLLSDPTCGPDVALPCAEGPDRRVFYLSPPKAGKHNLKHSQLIPLMFGQDGDRHADQLLTDGPHCVSRVSWGPGTLTLSGTPSAYYMREVIGAMGAIRALALSAFGLADLDAAQPHPGDRASASPHVVHISRSPEFVKGMPQTGRGRFIVDDTPMLDAYAAEGGDATRCCDFTKAELPEMVEAFAKADIVVGLHGAGLTNAMYAREGVVIVELVGGYGGDSDFYLRAAAARKGSHVKIRMPDRKEHVMTQALGDKIAKCSVGLWKGTTEFCDAIDEAFEINLNPAGTTMLPRPAPVPASGAAIDYEIAPCEVTMRCPDDNPLAAMMEARGRGRGGRGGRGRGGRGGGRNEL